MVVLIITFDNFHILNSFFLDYVEPDNPQRLEPWPHTWCRDPRQCHSIWEQTVQQLSVQRAHLLNLSILGVMIWVFSGSSFWNFIPGIKMHWHILVEISQDKHEIGHEDGVRLGKIFHLMVFNLKVVDTLEVVQGAPFYTHLDGATDDIDRSVIVWECGDVGQPCLRGFCPHRQVSSPLRVGWGTKRGSG